MRHGFEGIDTTAIYTLTDPVSKEIRYVGKTRHPKYRLYQHISDSRREKEKGEKAQWIVSLLKVGLRPQFDILEIVNGNGDAEEKYWIGKYLEWGFPLLNGVLAEGESEYTKKQRSLSRLGKKQTPEWRKNITLANSKGKYQVFKGSVFLGEFDSMFLAARGVGLSPGHIGRMARNEFKSPNYSVKLIKKCREF